MWEVLMAYERMSRRDIFALEAMKVALAAHPDRDALIVAFNAFTVAGELVRLLDKPAPGEDVGSVMSEFDDSPQQVSDAVLGRSEVSVPVDMGSVDKEFL
jgi:hypothetical protein